MSEQLRVGFASVEDATLESTWSGTPLNTMNRLRAYADLTVVPITPLMTTMKYLYLPYKLLEKVTGKYFVWYLQPLALRYLANQVAKVYREQKLDVIFSTSSVPVSRLPADIPYVFWTDAVFHAMEGYYPGLFSNLSEKTRKAGEAQEEASIRGARFACYSSHWSAGTAAKFTDADRVKVLPYGPNMPIQHGRDDVRSFCAERRRAGDESCVLLFVGKDWERKGGPAAMEATRLLNEAGVVATLQVIGCTPPGELPAYVEVLGSLSKSIPEQRARMEQAFREADIFIMPSKAEASAIVLAEAAGWGLPTLTCDTGGLADYVINDETGYRLPVSDTGAGFAEAAKKILANYERLALGAYDNYKNRLNWETSVERLVETLRAARKR